MIGLASDHAGYELKQFVMQYLTEKGEAFKDYGTYSTDSCDYPDYAHALARAIEAPEGFGVREEGLQPECERGIAICGSGEGIAMTLNKHQHIRAALVWQPEIARLCRQHNDANVLVMPGRFITTETAREIMDAFLSTPFEGGRHQRRLEKIPVR